MLEEIMEPLLYEFSTKPVEFSSKQSSTDTTLLWLLTSITYLSGLLCC